MTNERVLTALAKLKDMRHMSQSEYWLIVWTLSDKEYKHV